MSGHVTEVTDSSFEEEVLNSPVPIIVDFWAEWCGPCKALAPKIDQVAQNYTGKVRVVKMNVDQNQRTPAQFGIRGIPTLIAFKDGEATNQVVGDQSVDDLKSFFDGTL
ncbi:MAG: thioredoxin [Deltaproteobacteria bacterium]|nr:thioredoxin [Deltaproteobacteria bacterium]